MCLLTFLWKWRPQSLDIAQKDGDYNCPGLVCENVSKYEDGRKRLVISGLRSEDRLQFLRHVGIPALQTGVAYNLKADDANLRESPWKR